MGGERLAVLAPFYHPDMAVIRASRSETLAERYARLARESGRRRVDVELRALDIVLLAALPVDRRCRSSVPIALARRRHERQPPLLYRGERVGRGGRVFTMLKFRTLGAAPRRASGRSSGEELVAPDARGVHARSAAGCVRRSSTRSRSSSTSCTAT